MAHRIGPTPQISQPTGNRTEDLQAMSRGFFMDSTDLRARLRDMVPKDGSERMDAPFPLVIFATVDLPPAADWEGSIVFDTTTNDLLFSDGSAWITIRDSTNTPTTPAFSAHKNGTNQTGIGSGTDTQITFSTEIYDRGGHFASNVWTPPAGLVTMKAQVFASGTLVAQNARISITKNGATTRFKSAFGVAAVANAGLDIAMADVANGTDAYGVAVNIATTAGNVTVDGTAENTWFMGEWLN